MPTAKVLIVEDDFVFCRQLEHSLPKLGYSVTAVVASGEAAILAAAETRPDLILMDIYLPGVLDGTEAARQIRRQTDTPVIYITGAKDLDTLERAKRTEPAGYLLKPFTAQSLQVTIEMALHTHQVEKQLRESEAHYQHLVERFDLATRAAGLGVWDWDIQKNQLVWDDQMYRLYGVKKEDFAGAYEAWIKGLHPDDVARSDEESLKARRGEKDYDTEFRVVWPDGAIRYIKAYGQVVRDSQGQPLRMTGVNFDITERQQAEAALHESEARFRLLFADMAEGVALHQLIYDEQGRPVNYEILDVNPQYETLLNLRREAVIHKRATEAYGTPAPPYLAEYAAVVESGQPSHFETLFPPMQKHFYISVAAMGKGQFATIFFDVTARVEAERARQQAEAALLASHHLLAQHVEERTHELRVANAELSRAMRAKDDFLAAMSHELRTPLTAILGLAEALQMAIYGPLTEKQLKSIQTIYTSGQHLLALITDILDLSKIEAGKLDLHPDQVAVADVCQASLRFVNEQAMKKHVDVSCALDGAAVSLQADERRLKQMLVNLLSNAVKFTPAGGQIGLQVTADAAQQVMHFIVWDTGIGISPENMAQLFKPFVQLDTRLAREYEGTGLGLALVRNMAELHGGSVSVESEGVAGKGSRFIISLPWTPDADAPALPALHPLAVNARPAADGHQALVLVAEDNVTTQGVLTNFLHSQAYGVALAKNGFEAIEKALELKPALILMDIQMPAMDGLEAIRRLRAMRELSATPIIAVTSLAMPGDRARCLAAGANEYLVKPVNLAKLVQTVEALLEPKPAQTPDPTPDPKGLQDP